MARTIYQYSDDEWLRLGRGDIDAVEVSPRAVEEGPGDDVDDVDNAEHSEPAP